jgi:hypothetical protein
MTTTAAVSNVIQLKFPEKGSRYEEAVERLADLSVALLAEGVTQEELLIAFGTHFANLGNELGATKGQQLEALCILHDDLKTMNL